MHICPHAIRKYICWVKRLFFVIIKEFSAEVVRRAGDAEEDRVTSLNRFLLLSGFLGLEGFRRFRES